MWSVPKDYDFDAAFVHPNRVCDIDLCLKTKRAFQRLASAMKEPFPVLTQVGLHFESAGSSDSAPTLSNGFLGGSAEQLRSLELYEDSFPELPKLLLSATQLVTLRLRRTPYSAYISPEAMVACLSALTSLETFDLGFISDEESFLYLRLESGCPPPPTHTVLPALTHFEFTGVGGYLDDLVARIAVPRLFHLSITFFPTTFSDTPHLEQFIDHAPGLEVFETARVIFDSETVQVRLSSQTSGNGLDVGIPCESLDDQLSYLAHAVPPLSTVENLYISGDQFYEAYWQDDTMNRLWLEYLEPLTSVENLYISKNFVQHIAPALQLLVRGRTAEMLPNLQNLFLEGFRPSGPVQKGIKQFVASRQLSGNPITISVWNKDGVRLKNRFALGSDDW
jgi:hypothetical protein